jgi:hypothetical protein
MFMKTTSICRGAVRAFRVRFVSLRAAVACDDPVSGPKYSALIGRVEAHLL